MTILVLGMAIVTSCEKEDVSPSNRVVLGTSQMTVGNMPNIVSGEGYRTVTTTGNVQSGSTYYGYFPGTGNGDGQYVCIIEHYKATEYVYIHDINMAGDTVKVTTVEVDLGKKYYY